MNDPINQINWIIARGRAGDKWRVADVAQPFLAAGQGEGEKGGRGEGGGRPFPPFSLSSLALHQAGLIF